MANVNVLNNLSGQLCILPATTGDAPTFIAPAATVAVDTTLWASRTTNLDYYITAGTVDPAPITLTYATNPASYAQDVAISTNSPTCDGAPTSYTVSPSLPAGLALDADTGEITGTPTAAHASANFTVTAHDAAGTTTCVVAITITA